MSALTAAGPDLRHAAPAGESGLPRLLAVGPPSSCRRIATGPRSGRAPVQARAAQVPWRSAHRASRGRRADRTGRRGVPGRQETRRSRSRRPGRGSGRQRRRGRAGQQQGRRAALVRTPSRARRPAGSPLRRSVHASAYLYVHRYDSRGGPDLAGHLRMALASRLGAGTDRVSVELVEAPARFLAGEETALVARINGGAARPGFKAAACSSVASAAGRPLCRTSRR